MSNIFQIKRGGTEPPYIETDDTTPNSSKSYYTKNGNTYTLFEGSEFAQGTTYYENVLKKFELGFYTSASTLYINNNGTIEVPFARVKVNNIDGTLPVSKGGTGQTAITASRLLYSKSTTQLAATSITSDGSYLGNISYLTINAAHQTDWRFYVNGNAILGPNSMWYVQDNRYNASTNPSNDTYGAGFYMNDSNGTTRAYVREMALTSGWQGIQTEAKRVVNNTNIYSTLNLLIDANGNRQAVLNSKLYANEGLTVTGNSALTGNLSVTGTIAGNELYSGSSTTTIDRHIYCTSQAGNIFLYSNGSSATGGRGIWLSAHGTGASKPIISVDTNNNITYYMGEIYGNTMPMTNGKMDVTTGRAKLFTNGIAISNPATANDQGWLRMTGTGESDSVLELGISDDGLAGEQVQVASYNTSSAITHKLILLEKGTGNLVTPNQVVHTVAPSSWRDGRTKAALRTLTLASDTTAYFPAISMKSYSGSWELGTYTSSNIVYLSYMTDTNYSSDTNAPTYQIKFTPNGDTGFYARNISYGTGDPSGGALGDIYIKYS